MARRNVGLRGLQQKQERKASAYFPRHPHHSIYSQYFPPGGLGQELMATEGDKLAELQFAEVSDQLARFKSNLEAFAVCVGSF